MTLLVVLLMGFAAHCGTCLASDYRILHEHFPDRAHAVVWRNWHAVEPSRIANVLGTSVENVVAMAESMGLPPMISIPQEQCTQGYFWMTLCRRNWHLLSIEQLALLLDTTPGKLLDFLKVEEHANWYILGNFKPKCDIVKYKKPHAQIRRRAACIKKVVEENFGPELYHTGEPRFAFIQHISNPEKYNSICHENKRHEIKDDVLNQPRFLCSCLKVFGDPLMDPRVDMYPEGLLQRLADLGVNGVWLYGVLSKLSPGSDDFPEFGKDYAIRQANLRTLVQRAKRYGIGVYIYINEPRAQPHSFFATRPNIAGAATGDSTRCMCTSDPLVRKWISDSLEHLFKNVPDLAGVFTITASENPTNCAWMGENTKIRCPRCQKRSIADIYTEVNKAVEAGVHRGNPRANVIAWDWGWPEGDVAREIINRLPKSIMLMSVSEWSMPIQRGGVPATVNEYSLSVVGPGPRATAHWAVAKAAGLRTVAKVQVNTSWELASLPYLPVLDLVAQHCKKLTASEVDGLMLSWTLGGYPSPNLRVVQLHIDRPQASEEEILDLIAHERFGARGAMSARKAWTAFSTAFQQYPYCQSALYLGPVQLGAANLLYTKNTGLKSTMVGFPFDLLGAWRGPYPPEIFASQFEKLSQGWEEGLPFLEDAVSKAPADHWAEAVEELQYAKAAGLYFRSVANQTRFIIARNALLSEKQLTPFRRQAFLEAARRAIEDEIVVARKMYTLAKQNSCIGYETASQYVYLPLDLVEKVINCQHILDSLSH